MAKELMKGLEDARKEFNNWQGKAAIYADFSDNTAWCRVGDLPSYHSDTVVTVVFKGDLHGRNDRFGVERLNDLLTAMIGKYNEGWTKDDFEMYGSHEFAEYLQ